MAVIIWWPIMVSCTVPLPEWGYPLWCCDQLFRLTGDLHWLRRLYPRVATYMHWWLEHRRDAEGWLVYACSWEVARTFPVASGRSKQEARLSSMCAPWTCRRVWRRGQRC